MPLVTIPTVFAPHIDPYFGVQIDTEEEKKICNIVRKMGWKEHGEQMIYMYELQNTNPEVKTTRLFTLTMKLLGIRSSKEATLWGLQIFREALVDHQRLHPEAHRSVEQVYVEPSFPAPEGRSMLGRFLDWVVVDQAAWAAVDPHSPTPCHVQHMQAFGANKILYEAGRR